LKKHRSTRNATSKVAIVDFGQRHQELFFPTIDPEYVSFQLKDCKID
jgi:hypothetical protein